ncbi:MAG: Holliday junction branch migration protein RuvA [Candidatus Komeilibacteria bacterium CG_4_10_14_0_2_um_filter_37_10]|uniref:Holliday junction branch migration complex subunit RuvA n=1 Tax=Candidatus Komeilibacteria bacterium CG_4_10_14_0_2_um_filter_37_10 TaxID=1974470 RepID=A0A2M7VGQ4_9BACT|nr:MAG: Holliday junction branch migration protein RuvA [Candidatus Komeilibacteria bacterium CG_4_10_14_0_2_um_filter_37_10]
MIAYLKGKIINKNDRSIILENNNIGYQIFLTETVLQSCEIGQEREFYIYQCVREDVLDLYGMSTLTELDFYHSLLSVSGVGPKSALAVLAVAKVEELKKAIWQGDPTLLRRVSGIGQKTAERIVVELKNKIDFIAQPASGLADEANDSEIIDALESLGYSLNVIRNAMRQVSSEPMASQQKVKEVLRIINHK